MIFLFVVMPKKRVYHAKHHGFDAIILIAIYIFASILLLIVFKILKLSFESYRRDLFFEAFSAIQWEPLA